MNIMRRVSDIVTLQNTIRSSITTYCGVIYRKDTFMKHLSSEYHNKFIIAYLQNIEGIKQSDKTPLANYSYIYISKANTIGSI